MPRNTPLRKFIKMTGRDPLKMTEKQRDKISSSARYKQWSSLNRMLKQAKRINAHNPNLKEEVMTPEQKAKEKMLRNKYDDSEMYYKMVEKYGKENGEKIYFAYIRKMAMKEEEQLDENKFAGWNERTLHRHLLDNGFKPDGGSKHGGYIHVKTGKKIKPVPRHKGDYAPGLVKGILDSMKSAMGLTEDIPTQKSEIPNPPNMNPTPNPIPNDHVNEIPKHDVNIKLFKNDPNVFKNKSDKLKIYKKGKKITKVSGTRLLPINKIKSELVNKGHDVQTSTGIKSRGVKRGFSAKEKNELRFTKGFHHHLIRLRKNNAGIKTNIANRVFNILNREEFEDHSLNIILENYKNKKIKIKKVMTGNSSPDTIILHPDIDNESKNK